MKPSPWFSGFVGGAALALAAMTVLIQYGKPLKDVPPQASGSANISGASLPAPSRGPEKAPVVIMDFSDFQCPFCKRVHPTVKKILEKYPDKVRFIFKHFPLSETPGQGSFLVHEASVCAHEQGKFWEFFDGAYDLPRKSDAASLKEFAVKTGLDPAAFSSCLESGRPAKVIQEDLAEGQAYGVQGTPTFLINGEELAGAYPYEKFEEMIEGALNPRARQAAAPPPPAAPVVFSDLQGRPSQGPENAKVTLVEFSDFHCPFCSQLESTLNEVLKGYEGKVRRVWRHYPLAMHPGSERTHQASECAHEQGKFWEYHDRLFLSGGPRTDEGYISAAQQLGLDMPKFQACLNGSASLETVRRDVSRGKESGVRGTPAVFINGTLYPGSRPAQNYKQVIDQELSAPSK